MLYVLWNLNFLDYVFYVFLKCHFKKRKKSHFWIFKKKRKKRILELCRPPDWEWERERERETAKQHQAAILNFVKIILCAKITSVVLPNLINICQIKAQMLFNPSTGSRGQIDPKPYKLFDIEK